MNKKLLLGLGAIIVLAVAYWLISPVWRTVKLDEKLPVATTTAPVMKDDLSDMDAQTKEVMDQKIAEMEDEVVEKDEPMPAVEPSVVGKATLVARAHDVEGSASFVQSGAETFLRFENLKAINGPDLRIYLSTGLNANDIVDLGPIRATEGNVNYAIPAGTDLTKYNNVLIWCRAFSVLFSHATL